MKHQAPSMSWLIEYIVVNVKLCKFTILLNFYFIYTHIFIWLDLWKWLQVCNYSTFDFSTLCLFPTIEKSEADFKGSGWGWEVNPVSLCQHNKFLFIWRGCSFRLHASVTRLPKPGLCVCVFSCSYLNGLMLEGVEISDGGLDSLPLHKKEWRENLCWFSLKKTSAADRDKNQDMCLNQDNCFKKHCTDRCCLLSQCSGEILKQVPHLVMHKGLVSMSKLWRNSEENKTKGGLSCLTAGRKLWNNYACYDMTFTQPKRNWSQTVRSLKCFNCSVLLRQSKVLSTHYLTRHEGAVSTKAGILFSTLLIRKSLVFERPKDWTLTSK